MLKDIDIAHQTDLLDIREVAKKIGLSEKDIILYGNDKAKVKDVSASSKEGSLILVTSINPTPFGEGKTTVAIGLHDAFWQLQKKSMLTLREPSMGPVFGMKGGATGGGYAQVVPMEDINLHFTGDFHAITSANNLISAMIDNHLYQGNILEIDPDKIFFERTMDMNDRVLRNLEVGVGGKTSGVARTEHFTITAASEIMAVFCMSKDWNDLRRRIDRIIVAQNIHGDFITVKDLGVTGSVLTLLKDAIYPNLVQTLEGNPVFIHGGPFANIAPGVNSIRAIETAKKLSSIVITEAGFGFDLGGFKFFDILCRKNDLKPTAVVLVVTIKALKYHGGVAVSEILEENDLCLKKGLANLEAHMSNLELFGVDYVVTLNRYLTDTEQEISIVRDFVQSKNRDFVVNEVYEQGGKGALSLAQTLLRFQTPKLTLLYENSFPLVDKINVVCQKMFHAKEVQYSEVALEKLKIYQRFFSDYPICIAKTQYSLSDQKDLLGFPKDFVVTVRDLHVSNGAEFIVVYLGNIMTMPGLSKTPAALSIDVSDNREIIGMY